MDRNAFSIENSGSSSFIVYTLKEDEKVDEIGVGMISNNRINYILPFSYSQFDNKRVFKYNITSKTNLKNYFYGIVDKNRLLNVFSCIADTMIGADEFMIDTKGFLLDPEYIYIDANSNIAWLAYLPSIDLASNNIDLTNFLKNIMNSVQFNQNENGDYLLKILSFLNSGSKISLLEFKKLIDDIKNGGNSRAASNMKQAYERQPIKEQNPVNKPTSQNNIENKHEVKHIDKGNQIKQPVKPVGKQAVKQPQINVGFDIPGMPVTSAPETEPEKIKDKEPMLAVKILKAIFIKPEKDEKQLKEKKVKQKKKDKIKNIKAEEYDTPQEKFDIPVNKSLESFPNVKPIYINREELASDEGATVILDSNGMKPIPYLLRLSNNEKIFLLKTIFKVGKSVKYNDYACTDNTTISRSHAEFITRDGEYYIVDKNSTNKTFINDMEIPANVERKIVHGDIIRLSDEDFIFNLF